MKIKKDTRRKWKNGIKTKIPKNKKILKNKLCSNNNK